MSAVSELVRTGDDLGLALEALDVAIKLAEQRGATPYETGILRGTYASIQRRRGAADTPLYPQHHTTHQVKRSARR